MKKNKGFQIFLGIALGIVLFALVNLGISTFYTQPEYSTYCTMDLSKQILTETECTAVGGQWHPNTPCQGLCTQQYNAYCDATYTCNQNYQTALTKYTNTIFYILVALGLILSVYGFFIRKQSFQITALGSGLALIIEGIVRNYNNKVPAFIAGAIAFVILAYFVNKKFNK